MVSCFWGHDLRILKPWFSLDIRWALVGRTSQSYYAARFSFEEMIDSVNLTSLYEDGSVSSMGVMVYMRWDCQSLVFNNDDFQSKDFPLCQFVIGG